MTLSEEILKLMREKDTFTIWGFTTMGYREVTALGLIKLPNTKIY